MMIARPFAGYAILGSTHKYAGIFHVHGLPASGRRLVLTVTLVRHLRPARCYRVAPIASPWRTYG